MIHKVLVKKYERYYSSQITNYADQWFSVSFPGFYTNKTDCHDITEIVLKVALNRPEDMNVQFALCLLAKFTFIF